MMDARSPPRRSAAADRSRERLILVAEQLFSEAGFDAVSLRTICAAAGLKNTSSVHYHFGDKAGLLDAIFELRERQLEPQRLALLARLESGGRLSEVEGLLGVLFLPYAHLYERSGSISAIRFISFYLNHMRPAGVPHPTDTQRVSTAGSRDAIRLLRSRLAYLGMHLFYRRLESVSAMFFSTYIQHAMSAERRRRDHAALFGDTIGMMAAAFTAAPWVEMGGIPPPAP